MATHDLWTVHDTKASFTHTLASLATATSRQTTMINNTSTFRPAAIVAFDIESNGSAPTAGSTYELYLLRGNAASPTVSTDNAGASDAAITIENAPMLGAIVVTATANKHFYGDFDTAALGPLGPLWGIAVKNNSGQSLHATEGNHLKTYQTYYQQIQ